jgi:hypothetical protein
MISASPVAFDRSISINKLLQLDEAIIAKEGNRRLLPKNCKAGASKSGRYSNISLN